MGSFNHKCNFSQLPARYGDRIVVMVGVRMTDNILEADGFAPGNSFTPVSVPIRGEYDDYGGIKNVDRTPGVETLEKFFGMNVEKIVDCAERITCGCEDQVKGDAKKIMDVLDKILMYSYYKKYSLKFSYIMEHESVFDALVAMNDLAVKDRYYWMIPHEAIERLGYSKELLGEENHYEIIRWTHESLPELKEKCYVWKKEDFDDYGKTVHTISDLCKYVGCDVPEVYKEKYYESRFKAGIKKLKEKKSAFDMLISRDDEYSFLRGFNRGLFNSGENSGISEFLICSLGENNEHMDIKFMKEVIEVALLYDAMRMLQMTWGNTNYYRQDVNYGPHIEFLRKCLDVAEEKKREYENDEDDED